MSTDRFIPTRFKSTDLADIEITKLKHSSQNCEPRTPEIAALASKYIEQAFYEKEITEEEYKKITNRLNKETDRFKNNCSCLIKTIAGKYKR